jgi:hypothetical protein
LNKTDYLSNCKVRLLEENVDNDIIKFEEKYRIKLPPLFIVFYQKYDCNKLNSNRATWYVKSNGHKTTISTDSIFQPIPNKYPKLEYVYDLETVASAFR